MFSDILRRKDYPLQFTETLVLCGKDSFPKLEWKHSVRGANEKG